MENGTILFVQMQVYDDSILPKEVNKKMNDIYEKFKIKPPISITVGGNNWTGITD